MIPSGQSEQTDLTEIVAAAILRIGGDTLAARLFHEQTESRSVEGLIAALGVPAAAAAERAARARRRAQAIVARSRKAGCEIVPSGSPAYPGPLAHIADPPIVLWVRGQTGALARPAVAVVGSRRPSAEGAALATRLGSELARAGLVVVSGMARGIDAAAHRGALRVGGTTVAVLGSGVDVIYPPEHADLADELMQAGCLVSELPPGTQPFPSHFPLRNRLISGLCIAVVVLEAAQKSGSLITARMALEQGRAVCAVPGGVASGCHQGCHALIKDGARLVETVEDVLDEIRWRAPGIPGHLRTKSIQDSELLARMGVAEAVDIDELAARTGRSGASLLAELGQLEVAGRVERTGGGFFVRLD